MSYFFELLVIVVILGTSWFSKNTNEQVIYKGFIHNPVYIEDSNSLAFIDCSDTSCSFNILDLSSEKVVVSIDEVDISGLKYYSPNSFFILEKNNGATIFGYSLREHTIFDLDISSKELTDTLLNNKNHFKGEPVYSLNHFDTNRFAHPQEYCLKSAGKINIPNEFNKDINLIREVKQIPLAGVAITYYLEIDNEKSLVRKEDSVCVLAPDKTEYLYIIDSHRIEKVIHN